jgi:E3 ubiquitin-protein ligase SHPRH
VDNVLLDANNNAKLSDFGFAKEVMANATMSSTFCGTEPYFCPVRMTNDRLILMLIPSLVFSSLCSQEIVMHKPYDPFAADVWAMGVMLYVMLNGRFPFHFREMHKNRELMLREQRTHGYEFRAEAAAKWSPEVKDVLSRTMTYDPDKRPTITMVRKMAWFK